MTTPKMEYNKIHALAGARKRVFQKFGDKLMHFYSLADDGLLIRDFMRRKPLIVDQITASAEMQVPGLVDYGVKFAGGSFASDIQRDIAVGPTSATGGTGNTHLAFPITSIGRFRGIQLHYNTTNSTTIKLYVAPANTAQGSVAANSIADSQSYAFNTVGVKTMDFNCPVDIEVASQMWVYLIYESGYSLQLWKTGTYTGVDYLAWGGSSWGAASGVGLVDAKLLGVNAVSWPSCDELTVAAWVSMQKLNGSTRVLAMSNDSVGTVQIYVADGKFKARVYNSASNQYDIADPSLVHPGFNMVAIEYSKLTNPRVFRLIVNGKSVGSTTPSDHPMLGQTTAFTAGARIFTTKSVTSPANCVIDDIFIANKALTDADWWDLYMNYITIAPLMQTEATEAS